LDQPFSLAVGSRREGPGADVPRFQLAYYGAEDARHVAGAVVAHDSLDALDAMPSEKGRRATKEGCTADAMFVRQDFRVGQSRSVVDRDVEEVPADTSRSRLAMAVTRNAMTRPGELTELLGVDVNQLARPAADVAIVWLRRVECAESR
jgi:hypothetical protein